MTKRELNEHIALRKELARVQTMRASLRIAAEPGAQVLTGTPHAPGYADKLGNLAAEIADVTAELERIQAAVRRQEPEVTAFINQIQDNQTRIIFRLRVLHAMSWSAIARAVGGKNTAHGIKNAYYRGLRKWCPPDTV